MLKIIGVIVVLAVVVVLVLAAGKPDHFRVRRSATIDAPPEQIFPLINDFHRWGAWSPYEHKDPDMNKAVLAAVQTRPYDVDEEVPEEQRSLEEQHRGDPHGRSTAEARQDRLRDHRLDEKEQERGREDRARVNA